MGEATDKDVEDSSRYLVIYSVSDVVNGISGVRVVNNPTSYKGD